MIIKHKYNQTEKQYALSNGVNGGDFLHSKTLDLEHHVQDIRYQLNETDKPTVVSKARQIKYLTKFLAKPLDDQQTFVVSSGNSDLMARHIGVSLFMSALKVFRERKAMLGRMPPVWHRLYGGYNDPLLSKDSGPNYSFLVISNVIDEMTVQKLEKLRDLLVRFEGTPKVLVLGTNKPLYLLRQRLLYPFTGCIHIGPATGQAQTNHTELL